MQKLISTKEQFRSLFAQQPYWTIDDLCQELGYAAISIRRFLKQMGYFSSFTHNSTFYTLSYVPTFNKNGIWFCDGVGFSKHGNLKQTLIHFIEHSSYGLSAKELEAKISVSCYAVLNHLYKSQKIDRLKTKRQFVYLSADARRKQRQTSALQLRAHQKRQPRESASLSAQAAVYVLAEFIKNPKASYEELSRAAAKQQVIAKPDAIARLFEKHDLKKTLN